MSNGRNIDTVISNFVRQSDGCFTAHDVVEYLIKVKSKINLTTRSFYIRFNTWCQDHNRSYIYLKGVYYLYPSAVDSWSTDCDFLNKYNNLIVDGRFFNYNPNLILNEV